MTASAGIGRRLAAAVAGLALAASLLTGCTSARSGLGTADESCYLALPVATKAVGGHGHLTGIRRFTLSSLHTVAPRLYGRLAHDVPKGQSVCLAAFTGHYAAPSVSKPLGQSTGVLAVAVVTSPANELLGTLILTRIPVNFRHIF